MGSLNTNNMNTLRCTVLRTSSPRIQNYTDSDGETGTGGNFLLSHAAPWHIHMAQVITQQKLHDSCNVPSDQFNVQFRLRHGSQPAGIYQLVTPITLYFFACDPRTSSPQ